MVKIIFNDKTEINAERNGTTFITDTKPSIPDDLTNIEIVEDGTTTVIQNAQFVECCPLDERYYFTFIETSEAELQHIKDRADIEYIAMMSDIEL